jgi:hypothetical protein
MGNRIFLEVYMNFYVEALGYLGTAFVLISMLMTSISKLRVFNICGSVMSATYALICHTYPIVILNLGMIAINVSQLIIAEKKRRKEEG